MKKIALSTLSLLMCFMAFAQTVQDVPQKISYSGVVTKKLGDKHELVKNTTANFSIRIQQGSEVLYSEEHSGVNVNGKGQVAFEIGKGTNGTPSFNSIKWYTLINPVINVAISSGSDVSVSGTITIRTVPYAFHAQTTRYLVDKSGKLWEMGPGGTLIPADGTTTPGEDPVTPVVTYSVSFDNSLETDALKLVSYQGGTFTLTPTVTKKTTTGTVVISDVLLAGEITAEVLTLASSDESVATLAFDDGKVTVTVSANTTVLRRTAMLNFTPKGGTAATTVELTQKTAPDPDLPDGPQSKDGNLKGTGHPFVRLTTYNIKKGGNGFTTKHDGSDGATNENGIFTFEDAQTSVPAGYLLPTEAELTTFMLHYGNHPNIMIGQEDYRTISGVYFRYVLEPFLLQSGYYLEILAVKADSEADAKVRFAANGDDVAARYFPGQNGESDGSYWSSSESTSSPTHAVRLYFVNKGANVEDSYRSTLSYARPLKP